MRCPLPGERHQENRTGTDRTGLCVWASLKHTGDWQGEQCFYELFEVMLKKPGGGWPSRVDEEVDAWIKRTGKPKPQYLQVQNADLEVLKAASLRGLMPAVTYGKSPTGRYDGRRIMHMVSLVHATDKWFCVLDNNYIGEQRFEWMTPSEFAASYVGTNGRGWSVISLASPPPPQPGGPKKMMFEFMLAATLLFRADEHGVKPWTDGNEWSISGRSVGRDEAMQAIEQLPPKTSSRFITVIGQDQDRAAALAIIGKPSWAQVRDFPANHWWVRQSGAYSGGRPTVYVQDNDGRVLHRQDDLRDLAWAVGQFDPSKEPDVRRPGQQPGGPPGSGLDWGTIGLSAGGAALLSAFIPTLLGLFFRRPLPPVTPPTPPAPPDGGPDVASPLIRQLIDRALRKVLEQLLQQK